MQYPNYPHWPADPYLVSVGSDTDFRAISWAAKPYYEGARSGELMFISLTERYPLARAAWAAMMDGKASQISMRYTNEYGRVAWFNAQRVPGKKMYDAIWSDTPLQTAGTYAHLILQHTSASSPVIANGFLHYSLDNVNPQWSLFYGQLDRSIILPIHSAWTEQLWHAGLDGGMIEPLVCHNMRAWWVHTTPKETEWAWAINRIHAPSTTLSVETFGAPLIVNDEDEPEDDESDNQ